MVSEVFIPKSKAEESKYQPKYCIQNGSTNCIVAVAVSRSREVGVAAIDLTSPHELLLSEIADSHGYVECLSLLNLYNPLEVLLLDSKNQHPIEQDLNILFESTSTQIVRVSRQYFDQTKGAQELLRIASNCVDQSICRSFTLMAAVSCLCKYVEFIQGIYLADHTITVLKMSSKYLIDSATIYSLEIVCSTRKNNGKSKVKMLKILLAHSNTVVIVFVRYCEYLQNFCRLKTPSHYARYDLVDILLKDSCSFFKLLEILPNFSDLDILLSQLVVVPKVITPRSARSSLTNLLSLKHTLNNIPHLVGVLEDTVSNVSGDRCLLLSMIDSLKRPEFVKAAQVIDKTIHNSDKESKDIIRRRHAECFAVKSGVEGLLDVSRQTYLDYLASMQEMVQGYSERYHLEVKLVFSRARGFHMKCKNGDLPEIFIRRAPKNYRCTTKALECLNSRSRNQLENIYALSHDAVQKVLNDIRPWSKYFTAAIETIALLDMMLSFANLVAVNSPERQYVRPHLSEKGNVVIKNGRHPIVEESMEKSFVGNSAYCDQFTNLQIITAPNCAGKSTYLKMIAIATILAQSGCFVPAEEAFLPIRTKLFTRIGTADDMERNCSSFAVEMEETAYIIENCDSKSLVLIDELGRGTSTEEGMALSWSVCEKLIEKQTKVYFATHYHDLCKISQVHRNVKNYNLFVKTLDNSAARHFAYQYQYKIQEGPSDSIGLYGIQIGKLCGLPKKLLEDCKYLFKGFAFKDSDSKRLSGPIYTSDFCNDEHLLYLILCFQNTELSDTALRMQLQLVQGKFLQ